MPVLQTRTLKFRTVSIGVGGDVAFPSIVAAPPLAWTITVFPAPPSMFIVAVKEVLLNGVKTTRIVSMPPVGMSFEGFGLPILNSAAPVQFTFAKYLLGMELVLVTLIS